MIGSSGTIAKRATGAYVSSYYDLISNQPFSSGDGLLLPRQP